jgi:protein TonB
MNALEAEPESGGRWQRVGIGAGIAGGLALTLILGAQHVVPATRLLSSVVGITVLDDSPVPPPNDEPPPPPEDLPKPEPLPLKAEPKAVPQAAPQEPQARPETPQQPQVGLDADSFGTGGGGGGAFAVGNTQMGTPVGAGGRGGNGTGTGDAPPAPRVARMVEAKSKATNAQPGYTARARRLAIEGLLIVEVDIDEHGKVTRTALRTHLEPELDAVAEKVVAKWDFEPALLGGRAVASTKFIRLRFALD